MSGPAIQQSACSCTQIHCLTGNCSCFQAKLLCSGSCNCNDCQNTESNKAKVESLYRSYLKRKADFDGLALVPYPRAPPGGYPVPLDFRGCGCKKTKCNAGRCVCYMEFYRCTSKCKCKNCANPFGLPGSDTNTEQRQGDTGGVSNVPNEAGQITPSSNIESGKADDTSSIAEQPVQVEEQVTQSRDNSGSDQNKRPRL